MSDRGSRTARILAGAAAALLAGGAVRAVRYRQVSARRGAGESTTFGTLRSAALTVVADDGVPLHVEVDEPTGAEGGARHRGETLEAPPLTVVFVHGFMLNLDCWHFQRAGYRGLVRTVFYDQRSHGRSGRAHPDAVSIEQLGADLRAVIEHAAPDGPVVLVGHSMGGMSIAALAESHPDLFAEKVAGVALVATTAGGLHPHRMLLPVVPEGLEGLGIEVGRRTIAALRRGHRAVDGVRRLGKPVARAFTDAYAFGTEVPREYVWFVDEMLAATPFSVLADFFPHFDHLDKWDALAALEGVPTTVVAGTADRLTAIGHSRKLHARLPGSTLVECDDAGHMVMMERHDRVNAALDQLIAAAAERVGR